MSLHGDGCTIYTDWSIRRKTEWELANVTTAGILMCF